MVDNIRVGRSGGPAAPPPTPLLLVSSSCIPILIVAHFRSNLGVEQPSPPRRRQGDLTRHARPRPPRRPFPRPKRAFAEAFRAREGPRARPGHSNVAADRGSQAGRERGWLTERPHRVTSLPGNTRGPHCCLILLRLSPSATLPPLCPAPSPFHASLRSFAGNAQPDVFFPRLPPSPPSSPWSSHRK